MEKSKQLEIQSYQLEELHVETNPEYRGHGDIPPAVTVDFGAFVHKTDLTRFAVALNMKSEEPVGPEHQLKFSARIVGFFAVSEPMVDRKVHPERAVNALTILYGLARAHMATSTAWFSAPTILPTVYFTDLVNAKVAAARQAAIAEPEQEQIEAATAAST